MKKKIIYFCILLGMLTMISGCKKTENDDVVTLKFMHRWTMEPMKSATETMIKKFEEENPDIKIEVLTATNSSYKQKIKTVINSEDAPDVFCTWGDEYLNKFVREGLVLDLTDFLKESGTMDSLVESQMTAFQYEGRYYGIPLKVDAKLWFYNKDIYKKMGLQPPETYSEFIEQLKIIQSAGITPIYNGNSNPYAGAHYLTTLNQKCVPEDILKSDYSLQSGEFTDPGYLQALQIYSDLHQYMNKDVAAYDWSFAYSGLINGDCALVYDQYVTVADSMEMDEQFTKEHLGVFPFPYIEGARGNQTIITGTPDGYAVSSKTKHPKEVYRFLEYMLSEENCKNYLESSYWVNARKDMCDNIQNYTDIQPLIDGMKYIRESTSTTPWIDTELDPKIAQTYVNGIQQIDTGEVTPEQLIRQIQQAAKSAKEERK